MEREGKHENNVCESSQQEPSAQPAPKEHSRTYAVIVYYFPHIFRFIQKSSLSIYYVPGSLQVTDDKTVNKIKSQLPWGLYSSRGMESIYHTLPVEMTDKKIKQQSKRERE